MNPRRQAWIRFMRGSSGSVAVEFALLLPVYILFILGIIEFGRMIWIRNTMEFAAETAARYGAVTGATEAQIEAYALTQLTGMDSLTISFTGTTVAGNIVTVVGTHDFTTIIADYVPIPAMTLTVTATFTK